MEQLENAEYYMRAFESEQVVRRKLEIENEELRAANKQLVERMDLNKQIYEGLLKKSGQEVTELIGTAARLSEEQLEIAKKDTPTPTAPEPSALAPKVEEGF